MAEQETKVCDTVYLDEETPAVMIIDQTLLPNEHKIIALKSPEEIWEAIYRLKVRGAPAIGVAAAMGLYVIMAHSMASDRKSFVQEFEKQKEYINSARPTAVNLSWALKRMEGVFLRVAGVDKGCVNNGLLPNAGRKEAALTVLDSREQESGEGADFERFRASILAALREEALQIYHEDIKVCRMIGENGVDLIRPGCGILTHCNAGRLATVRYGTATSPMYLAHERGIEFRVYCDETRPLLQGARLTAYELSQAGIDTTLVCDNMSASLMQQGKIDMIFVGADRVAANGDAANKIGTAVVAAVAKRYGVPLFVCAPISTIDMATATGKDIVIEQRASEEVTDMWYEKPMAPRGVKVYNPAFDVTDHSDIAGIITERGLLKPPFDEALAKVMGS